MIQDSNLDKNKFIKSKIWDTRSESLWDKFMKYIVDLFPLGHRPCMLATLVFESVTFENIQNKK